MKSPSMPRSQRSTVKRLKERGSYDLEDIYRILDEGIVCHVGLAVQGQPFVIPMAYARRHDKLILHGSVASRLMQEIGQGVEACVTVTLLDGLVLARSAFHHSMNYRSVVALGTTRPIKSKEEKRAALATLVEHLVPGRWKDARPPNDQEIAATEVLEFSLDEASAKIRTGPPKDAENDLDLPIWAGEIPLQLRPLAPVAAPELQTEADVPTYAMKYRRPGWK